MANRAEGVNPKILKWARERAGYSLDEVADSFKKDPDDIRRWESGDGIPTYNQLARLAYTLYKRPIALFFFPEPPIEPDIGESFRTLPNFELHSLHPDTRHAIREARAMQLGLPELTNRPQPNERYIFRDIKVSPEADVRRLAVEVRKYLGVELSDQIAWAGTDDALKQWRRFVEEVGVFVFKRSFRQGDVSGFSLWDPIFPVIYINNSTSKTRQIFTLFHELAHILLNSSGITKQDDRYISALTGVARRVETLCNQFAGELLVPAADFDSRLERSEITDQFIKSEANRYHVSREVILRKLLDRGSITREEYETKSQQWIDDYKRQKAKRSGGGDYYATQAAYLGETYLGLAFAKHYRGECTLQQLADYLNVRAANVAGLEQYAFRQGAGR